MTLPALITNQRNRELETSLKKAYSSIGQALDMYQAENGERYTPEMNATPLKPILLKYLKMAKDCGGRTENNGVAYPPSCVGSSSTLYKTYNGKSTVQNLYLDDGQFVLGDGMIVLLENPVLLRRVFISIDVNGYRKNPNRLGHDMFTFQIDSKGKLIPMGLNGTDYYDANDKYCSLSDTSIYNGIACTYKALSEKDYFKNLPK